MSRYRRVDVSVWRDGFFKSLTPDARMLWLYLLTSPQSTPCGIFVFTADMARMDLRWPVGQMTVALKEVVGRGGPKRVQWDAENMVLLLPNWLKYNPPKNPNAIKSWRTTIEALPEDSPLISEWFHVVKLFLEQYSEPLCKLFCDMFAYTGSGSGSGSGAGDPSSRVEISAPADPPINPPALEQAIWNEYRIRYETKMGGAIPTHSEGNHVKNARDIVRLCRGYERFKDFTADDEGRLAFVCKILDRFFAIDRGEIPDKDYRFGDFKSGFNKLYQQARIEKGAR